MRKGSILIARSRENFWDPTVTTCTSAKHWRCIKTRSSMPDAHTIHYFDIPKEGIILVRASSTRSHGGIYGNAQTRPFLEGKSSIGRLGIDIHATAARAMSDSAIRGRSRFPSGTGADLCRNADWSNPLLCDRRRCGSHVQHEEECQV